MLLRSRSLPLHAARRHLLARTCAPSGGRWDVEELPPEAGLESGPPFTPKIPLHLETSWCKRRYQDNLIVAVVGRSDDLEHLMLKELGSFLESVGVVYVGVPVS